MLHANGAFQLLHLSFYARCVLTKGAAEWRESESSRPETGNHVQSRCPSALALNAENAGMGAFTKSAADWRESESLRPESARRVQSRCPGALALNAESAGMVAKNGKTLQY